VPSGDMPVGWEAEFEDEVSAVCRRVPPWCAAVVRSLFLDPKCGGELKSISRSAGQAIHLVRKQLRGATL
jgi:hypothetical protein